MSRFSESSEIMQPMWQQKPSSQYNWTARLLQEWEGDIRLLYTLWRRNLTWKVLNSQFKRRTEHTLSQVWKPATFWMLHWKIISLSTENHIKQYVHSAWAECRGLNPKYGGTYGNHWALTFKNRGPINRTGVPLPSRWCIIYIYINKYKYWVF
jgi:hypothetical protein